jgi:hypothetical protein
VDLDQPIYGTFDGRSHCGGIFVNSVSGSHVLKDRFFLAAVDGRRVILPENAERYTVNVRCGEHQLELVYTGYDGGRSYKPVTARASLTMRIDADCEYHVRGLVAGAEASIWIEEAKSNSVLTAKLNAPIVKRDTNNKFMGMPVISK